MEKPIYIVGDTHGKWSQLFNRIKQFDIRDCYLICVGDVGIGFVSKEKQDAYIQNLNTSFSERNIEFIAIRGNHDDPDYFDGSVDYDNFKLIKDYSNKIINDVKFLFVGGAVSIDRIDRDVDRDYWEDELFVLKPELVEKCDVLITHSAPTWIGPNDKKGIEGWCMHDPEMWKECVKERAAHDRLIELSTPSQHFCGHFHLSAYSSVNGCDSKILNELEFTEFRKK